MSLITTPAFNDTTTVDSLVLSSLCQLIVSNSVKEINLRGFVTSNDGVRVSLPFEKPLSAQALTQQTRDLFLTRWYRKCAAWFSSRRANISGHSIETIS